MQKNERNPLPTYRNPPPPPPSKEKQQPGAFDIKELEWFECLEILLVDFEPALNKSDATDFWTTLEIANAVASHFGLPLGEINKLDVYKAMLYKEYSYTRSGEIALEWMLKKRVGYEKAPIEDY